MDYVLPIRVERGADAAELGAYVRTISRRVHVIVVDGSDSLQFRRNARHFTAAVHVPPRSDLRFANGKVNGVCTGLALCTSEKVVIADDDVRYRCRDLDRVELLLDEADLVRPQNYFDPAPWHARWDTARSLINRGVGSGDFPGTLAVRLTERLRREGYDGDVLFENLELIRTIRADGGREVVAGDLYVPRRPPTARHFARQRIRQAYDSQAQPVRLAVELAVLPAAVAAARRPRWLVAASVLTMALAEFGRRRDGGTSYFPRDAVLYVPMWVGERALCAWLAVGQRLLLGGTCFGGHRIRRAAHSVGQLRRAAAA
ncbi:MAG: hypothetical protein JWO57_3751 [Pseudonocardiales bacterium]|nr:hypothetical protein [Pseudonocardiales bacterium]